MAGGYRSHCPGAVQQILAALRPQRLDGREHLFHDGQVDVPRQGALSGCVRPQRPGAVLLVRSCIADRLYRLHRGAGGGNHRFCVFFALRSAHSGTAGRAGTAPGLGRAARGGHCRQPGLCPRRQRRGTAAAVSGVCAVRCGENAAGHPPDAAAHRGAARFSGRMCPLAQVYGAGVLPRLGGGAGRRLPVARAGGTAGQKRGRLPWRHGAGDPAVGHLLRRKQCAGGLVHLLLL